MTRVRAAARAAALGMVFAGLLASCHGGEETVPTPTAPPTPSATATAPPLGARVWLAALRIARDPNDLDADAQRLLSQVDGATVVSPAACFRGLPDGPAPADYILGIVAANRSDLNRLVAGSGFAPMFEANVRVLCVD